MAFKAGDKKPENAGRKKGTPNKKTQFLLDIFEEADYCPAIELLKILKGEKVGEKIIVLEDKEIADIHMKLMEYKFPKRKAVEHSGSIDGMGAVVGIEQFIKQQNEKLKEQK